MVKAKLYFSLLLYIKKEPKLQNFQEPTSASTKYLRKQLSLIFTETKIQVKTVRFDPFPELICFVWVLSIRNKKRSKALYHQQEKEGKPTASFIVPTAVGH